MTPNRKSSVCGTREPQVPYEGHIYLFRKILEEGKEVGHLACFFYVSTGLSAI